MLLTTSSIFDINPQSWVVEEASSAPPSTIFLPHFNPSGNNMGQECAFIAEAARRLFCNRFIPGTGTLRKIPNITKLGIKLYKLATLHSERGKLRKSLIQSYALE